MNGKQIAGLLLVGCLLAGHRPETFAPRPAPNPWKDDYRPVSGMEHYRKWGPYNVHDPACIRVGDYYYVYSTDAIFAENQEALLRAGAPAGFLQVRRSADLVHWDYVGWAFPEIPAEAVAWVREHAGGRGATNIWAPYPAFHNGVYRLYYCVSAFGRKASYIGLAESASPEGPWVQKGCVVKTADESAMNAIDPSVIVDPQTGQWWMHYGSFFGGLYCVELDPATGLPVKAGDHGHLIARRANYTQDNLEAPEIIYCPERKEYYLFVSYDPLMTTYNVRVGRSDSPAGPFLDFAGQDMKDTVNNYPILTAPYRFDNHPGWAGAAHCAVLRTAAGEYFMLHQGRLSPHNMLMTLHVRRVFFNAAGWPVVSPERYAGIPPRTFAKADLAGEWEIVRIREPRRERRLEAGQIPWGEGALTEGEWNRSSRLLLSADGKAGTDGQWSFLPDRQAIKLTVNGENIDELLIFAGQDWENERETVLFTGLDRDGRSVWGKRIK